MLFVLGGILGLVSLLLPHPASSDEAALTVIDATAFLVGAAVLGFAARIPTWLVHALTAGGAVLICAAIYSTGIATGLYSTMFVWIVLFSAYFFSTRAMVVHLAWVLAAYAVVLAALGNAGGYSPFTRWLLTAISLAVAGGLTSWLATARRQVQERAERFFSLSRDLLCTADPAG
jgi:hypothetical protein